MAFVIYAALTLILRLIQVVIFVSKCHFRNNTRCFPLNVGFLNHAKENREGEPRRRTGNPGTLFCSLTFNLCLSFVAGVQCCDIQMCMHLTSDANTT